jgi:hypothetical protein
MFLLYFYRDTRPAPRGANGGEYCVFWQNARVVHRVIHILPERYGLFPASRFISWSNWSQR